MTTRIFDLPRYVFALAVANNEDWRDSWAYVDTGGQPISLAGCALDFVMVSASTGAAVIIASTSKLVGGLPTNGRVVGGGIAGNAVGIDIPRAVMRRIPPGDYRHETQARASQITKTIARGAVTIREGLTP